MISWDRGKKFVIKELRYNRVRYIRAFLSHTKKGSGRDQKKLFVITEFRYIRVRYNRVSLYRYICQKTNTVVLPVKRRCNLY